MRFTYRSARSPSLTAALLLILAVETLAVHFAVASRSRVAAWVLTAISLWAMWYLLADYRALASGAIEIDDTRVRLSIGRRHDISLLREEIRAVIRPTFRDLPAPGTRDAQDYRNLTKPAAPNVLLTLNAPRRVRLVAGITRELRRLGLHVDDPAAFVRAATSLGGE